MVHLRQRDNSIDDAHQSRHHFERDGRQAQLRRGHPRDSLGQVDGFDECVWLARHDVGFARLGSLHSGDVNLGDVVDVRPAVSHLLRQHGQLAPQVLVQQLVLGAFVAGAVNHAGHEDDERQPLFDHRHCDLIMRLPFGAIVRAQMGAVVAVGLVVAVAAGVGKDGQRAGIDPARDVQLCHQFQHVARAFDVNGFGGGAVDPDPDPGRQVEDSVDAAHGVAHAGFVGDVTGHDGHTQVGKALRFGRRAGQRHHLVSRLNQQPGHPPADEPRCTGDKVFHRSPLFL